MDAPESAMPDLPAHPTDVAWPTVDWATGPVPAAVDVAPLLDEVMDPEGALTRTRAVVVIHRGRLVAERYGDRTDAWGAVTGEPVDEHTKLISWSMAKSMLHATIGMLIGDGLLSLDDPIHAPEWGPDDPRRAITIEHALSMRDGLDFAEVYDVEAGVSHVVEMLYGPGTDDVAGYVAGRPLAHPPATHFNYSSGTSNLLSRHVKHVLGGQAAYEAFLRDRLFDAIGMTSAEPRFDAAGTWVGSSYVWATARDMARFGEFYLRDGVWEGRRLLPEGWVDTARRARSVGDDGRMHSMHWWVVGDDLGTFWASGFEGQSIMICPPLDLVVVRLGKSLDTQADALFDWRIRMVDAWRPVLDSPA